MPAPILPEPNKPARKSKSEVMAEALAGRSLFRMDDLRLDRLALVNHYHIMLNDQDALRALKGIADVTTARVGIYVDELSKQLVPDEAPRKKGDSEVLSPSTPEDELRKMFTLQELETASLVLKRLGEFREKVAVEFREIVPQDKKDTFYTPQSRPYNEWKAEFDETIGSPARPAQAPSPANAPKTAEPKKTQVQTAKKRTRSRSSRPI